MPFSMAPKYVYEPDKFEHGRLMALLRYGVMKEDPQERYRKPTKQQLEEQTWKRPWEASQGILPTFSGRPVRRRRSRLQP